MASARDALNELRWTTGLAGVTITYRHRGAPSGGSPRRRRRSAAAPTSRPTADGGSSSAGDERTVLADEVALAHGGFDVPAKPGQSATIPWHRVLRIGRGGAVLWARR